MRWWSAWLTAALVATTTAVSGLTQSGVITIEHNPPEFQESILPGGPQIRDEQVYYSSPDNGDSERPPTSPEQAPDIGEISPEIPDSPPQEGSEPPGSQGTEVVPDTPNPPSPPEEDASGEESVERPADPPASPDDEGSNDRSVNDDAGVDVVEPEGDPENILPPAADVENEEGSGDDNDQNSGDGSGDDKDDASGDGSGDDNEVGSGNGSDEEENVPENNVNLIVETASGLVQGHAWRQNEDIVSYIDIPYGKFTSPFQAAVGADAWDGLHDVKDHDKRCPQLQGDTYVGEVDCLTLSIFKPKDAEDASVLFHIHDDDFAGSGDPSVYGPEYLVANGIILVLPNYRLGSLGFLCVQNETAPGNAGLKDLSLALTWVSDNIKKFGGNPDNIVVSGDGKSGAFAGFLALSPMSRDNVSKVIAESGSFLSYWALDRDPTVVANELFEKIRAAQNPQSRLEITLSEVTAAAIVRAAKGMEFKPCLEVKTEDAFMTETPYTIMTTEKIDKSFLIGSATFAGIHEALLQTEDSIKQINDDHTLLLPNDLVFDTTALRNEVGTKVKAQYFGEDDISLDDTKNLSLCFTDIGYTGPGIRSARMLVEAGATVFFYEFAFVGEFNRVLHSIDQPVEGAVRSDIVGYLFTQDGLVPGELHADENKMIDTLTKLWTSFLKTGTPSTDTITWKKLEATDHDKEEWLLIDAEPELKTGVHVDRLPLWTEIYSQYFIDNSHGPELSPSVYTVLVLQIVFWLGFCRNAGHIF
ncbi:esterase FE4-like [Anticarsia gemmatalis]|uniref:esterase FE4-like n=1 Tax=Anticarsia gemmatalis TaxID=129554 RepID=UPI003F75CC3C